MAGAPVLPGAAAGDPLSPLSQAGVWGWRHQAGRWQGLDLCWGQPAPWRLTQRMGNPKMQQVPAVTQLPAEVGQGRRQGGSSIGRWWLGTPWPGRWSWDCLREVKWVWSRSPWAGDGAQLLACEVGDALMSLWDTCLSLPDE